MELQKKVYSSMSGHRRKDRRQGVVLRNTLLSSKGT
jgi:hypothetical protein